MSGLWAAEKAEVYRYTAFSVLGGGSRLPFTTETGRAVIRVRGGTIAADATPLPYSIPRPGIAQFEEQHLGRHLRIASALIDASVIGRYYLESYLDPDTIMPVRAVRWRSQCPDIVLDFTAPGEVTLTKADREVPRGFRRFFGTADEETYDVTAYPEGFAVGSNVTDLLGAFVRVNTVLKNADEISEPIYLFGMKKTTTSVYCARLDPDPSEEMEFVLDQVKVKRRCRAFNVTLSYAACLEVTAGLTLEAVREQFLPERSVDEIGQLLGQLLGAPLSKCVGQFVAVPVSMTTYNRVFDRDKGFEGPFGLSEAGKLWADVETGFPVMLEGSAYGIGVRLVLSSAPGLFSAAEGKAPDADVPQ